MPDRQQYPTNAIGKPATHDQIKKCGVVDMSVIFCRNPPLGLRKPGCQVCALVGHSPFIGVILELPIIGGLTAPAAITELRVRASFRYRKPLQMDARSAQPLDQIAYA